MASLREQLFNIHSLPKDALKIMKSEGRKIRLGKNADPKLVNRIDRNIDKRYKVIGKKIKSSLPMLGILYGSKVAIMHGLAKANESKQKKDRVI